MLTSLMDILFGCWHRRYSFPITVRPAGRSRAATLTGTYVVCLDCGKEFPYDWGKMKVVPFPGKRGAALAESPDLHGKATAA